MKKVIPQIIVTLSILFSFLTCLPGQENDPNWRSPAGDWEEFKSYEGGFRILSPGPVRENTDTIETRIGALVYHTFFHQEEGQGNDNLLYMVSYVDYPEQTVHSDSTELLPDFFEATVESAAFSIDGEVRYAHPVEFFNYPGYIWRIDYLNGQAVIKTKAYLVGRRLYTLQTITYRELNLNTASDKFMDAFRLLDQ